MNRAAPDHRLVVLLGAQLALTGCWPGSPIKDAPAPEGEAADSSAETGGGPGSDSGHSGSSGDSADAESSPEGDSGASDSAVPVETGGSTDTGDCATSWYTDGDGDGYGDGGVVEIACDAPEGTVAEAGDCDDSDPGVSPRAVELCDGLDNDCDGVADLDCMDCDEAVPNHFGTITDALAVASDGDRICVGPGTYVENLDFGGSEVTVDGVQGPARTLLDGGGVGPVVSFGSGEGPDAVLQGFTVQNGWDFTGAGVHIEGSSPTLIDLIVTDNHAGWDNGGGVSIEDGDPSFVSVWIQGNAAWQVYCGYEYGDGGGVYMIGSDAVFEDVIIRDNTAGQLGGGIMMEDSNPTLVNVSLSGNTAVNVGGGGIYASGSKASLEDVIIEDNQAGSSVWATVRGGGLYLSSGSELSLVNAVISGNIASYDGEGGGLYVADASAQLINSLLQKNGADGDGGGAFVDGDGTLTVTYSDLWDNTPDDLYGVDDPTGTDGVLAEDPGLIDADTLHLAEDSPLVDAGDPSILDPDGTTSDIGAYGGPDAAGWDLDRDGWPGWWLPGTYDPATSGGLDCDDDDATITPGSGC